MVNNSSNINKMINHISPQNKETTTNTMRHEDRNLGSDLEQAQQCGLYHET